MSLESTTGKGTKFRVFLPAAEETATSGRPQGSIHPFLEHGNGELVLIVDDEANVRDLVRVILTRHGYRTLVAGNGNEAVAHYTPRATEMALVITDLNMPGMGGVEFANEALRLNKAVKIIFMSGAESGSGFGNAGAVPFHTLKKPFTSELLLRRIQEALNPPTAVR